MAKQIAKLLKADLNSTSNLAMIAKMLEKKGRANDTILAHITQREAEMLKERGGAGTVNPETGLLEFYDFDAPFSTPDYSAYTPEAPTATQITPAEPIPTVQAGQPEVGIPLYDSRGNAIDSSGNVMDSSSSAAPASAAAPIEGRYNYGEGGGSGGLQLSKVGDYGVVNIPARARDVPQLPVSSGVGYGVTDTSQPTVAADQAAPTTKPWYDKISTADMLRLGLAGGLGLYGASQTKKAAEQQQQAMEEQKNLAAPYQAQGKELVRAAQAGELTPAAAQSYQALQARLAQGAESRGGAGAAQSAAQAEAYRQQLLQGQYDYGLKVSNIGDNIAIGAIRTGMQADQQLNQANSSFYTNLAMIGAGIPMYTSRG